jgi:LysR family transcriptional activator of nhaA
MAFLNYHHLRYFRAIANEGSLTRAAKRLNISQSALSTQLRSLEESLGQQLFHRQNKSLVLTEAGHIALDYAQSIFRSGEELVDVLKNQRSRLRKILRVGAVATLSRNFQLSMLKPLIGRADLELILRSGNLRDLLVQLRAHTLDVVLSNLPVRRDAETDWHSHLVDEQPVSLIGLRSRKRTRFRFPEDLRTTPLVLPSLDSNIRVAFDLMLEQIGIRPIIAAEVDDMAMLRLLASEGAGLALVPPVVVQGELESGQLVERHRITQIRESFYAITPSRRFPNPILRTLVEGIGRKGKSQAGMR